MTRKVFLQTASLVAGASTNRMSGQKASEPESPETVLARIRSRIETLLRTPQADLYVRHLRSVLALCEEESLKLQFLGTARDEKTKELLGYLKSIENDLKDDGGRPQAFLLDGRRALLLARISRSDGTLQPYAVSLPPHWDANKAYPLLVELHGRGSDLPLGLMSDTFLPHKSEAITLVPWLRGNGTWREDNGSEPDIWEAIDDLKNFAKLDPDRWYICGHSWGGDDVWAIVQRTPDLWAAAGIMSGHPGSAPAELGLLPNVRHIPFYLWLGDQDPIPNRKPALEQFRDGLTGVGDRPEVVVAKGVGHNPRPQDGAAMKDWLFEHVRQRPSHFSFIADTPKHRGIRGVSIPQRYPLAYGNAEPRVRFECWIEGSTIRIQTSDTKALDVDLGPGGLNISGTATLIVNGKTRFSGAAPQKALALDL
jgi:pimeloyl-ACP methyl ester carboxylesterase